LNLHGYFTGLNAKKQQKNDPKINYFMQLTNTGSTSSSVLDIYNFMEVP
jgi:hypothetical protein